MAYYPYGYVDNTSEDISLLTSEVSTIQGQITGLNSSITTITTDISTLNTEVAGLVPSGLTAGDFIIAASATSYGQSTVISQSSNDINIAGPVSTTKFNVNNASGVSVITVDSSTPEISLYANTGIYDTMFVQPAAASSGALYVLDPSGNNVFNVSTASSGIVSIAGLDSTSKFTVNNAGGISIINVDTSTPEVNISSFTSIYNPLLIKPTTGSPSAFYVQDPSGNFVLNVRTSGNGEVGVGGVDDTNKFSIQTSAGTDILTVDTLNQQVFIQTPSDSNRALDIKDSAGNEVLYVATVTAPSEVVATLKTVFPDGSRT